MALSGQGKGYNLWLEQACPLLNSLVRSVESCLELPSRLVTDRQRSETMVDLLISGQSGVSALAKSIEVQRGHR